MLTCQMYRDYRNLMVNKYRENVERRLTPSDLRTVLVGEHTAIYRVWSFLDHWGLINFQAKDGVSHEGNEGPAPFKIAPSGTFSLVCAVVRERSSYFCCFCCFFCCFCWPHWGVTNFQAKDGVSHEGDEGPAPFKQ
jgi:hypothetical protein